HLPRLADMLKALIKPTDIRLSLLAVGRNRGNFPAFLQPVDTIRLTLEKPAAASTNIGSYGIETTSIAILAG
ncbi:MAG TPA: hypothetical protein VD811_02350, partial [Desulfuromonadales bacterium]|nr:hypothetical protein [Desulfuromonadales bacterium]